MRFRCLEVLSNLPPGAAVEGVIALDRRVGSDYNYLLNMESGVMAPLPQNKNDIVGGLRVSPDGKWLAYVKFLEGDSGGWLMIKTADGERYKEILWENNWNGIAQWLDSERLMIIRRTWSGDGPFELDGITVLNPFTGDRQVLLPEYPGIYTITAPGVEWGPYDLSRTVYDPTLTRVVYPVLEENDSPVVLWDIRAKQELARIHSIGYLFGREPKWSPDGEQFVTNAFPQLNDDSNINDDPNIKPFSGSELFSVSRDGQIKQLTNLTTKYQVVLYNYNWSHDGRYIAFWLKATPSPFDDERLAVLDVMTGEVTNYCVPGDPHDHQPPIWSLNGHQLVVGLGIHKMKNTGL
jgi:hypothetical protein